MATPTALSIEEFRDKINESQVACRVCGFKSHSIVAHLKEKHSLSVAQYKERYKDGMVASHIITELLRLIPRKPATVDTLEEFVNPFTGSESNAVVADLKKQLKPDGANLAALVPAVIKDFYFEPAPSRAMGYALLKCKNVFIEGPTGCGKTELIMQVHAITGKAIKRVNMNGDVTVANFLGKREVDAVKGTYFLKGALPLAMEGGYTLLIDEIDYMPPHIAAVLNSVAEGGRTLYLPDMGETIVAKEGFNICATGNTGGKGDATGVYAGTEILNSAFLDRFPVKLSMTYLPKEEEIKMLQNRFPAANVAQIKELVALANEVRGSFLSGALPMTISTRKLIDMLDMIPFFGVAESMKLCILNWADKDTQSTVIGLIQRIMPNTAKELK